VAEAEAHVHLTPAPSRGGIVDRGIGWLERRPAVMLPIFIGVALRVLTRFI
jgi:hypothetical protein